MSFYIFDDFFFNIEETVVLENLRVVILNIFFVWGFRYVNIFLVFVIVFSRVGRWLLIGYFLFVFEFFVIICLFWNEFKLFVIIYV